MRKLKNILEVHQLAEQGFNISAIARKCQLSRTTVYDYLAVDFEKAARWVDTLQSRKKKLDPYKEIIVTWLMEHPDLSASQISDWLEEKYSYTGAGDSTVRAYVKELRELHHIPKSMTHRNYEAVPELPKGYQMQVDFGEISVKSVKETSKKLYVIAFVLSHSRHKYAEWQDRPFTTKDVLRCHEHAFQFYGGMTEEIVYDQDKLMTVSENNGDIVYTEAFQAYRQQRGFKVYMCRAADPESKGKVENVVKFIKRNFAKHRTFHSLDSWNEQCNNWLERKGNYQVHNTIKKRPVEVFALEKPHLQKVSAPLSYESANGTTSVSRTVQKDNIIKYQSNRYSVPWGTYQPMGDNQVDLETEEGQLIIRKKGHDTPIAEHEFAKGKGQLVKNTNHGRDRSKGLSAYKKSVIEAYDQSRSVELFIEENARRYSRYVRDHLKMMMQVIDQYPESAITALERCVTENRWSANHLRDTAKYLHQKSQSTALQETIQHNDLLESVESIHANEKASVRELEGYLDILGGIRN